MKIIIVAGLVVTIATIAIIAMVIFSNVLSTNLPIFDTTMSTPTQNPIASVLVENKTISALVADTNNLFALEFYKHIVSSEEENNKNIFFSPVSIRVAFSILYEGARENTAQQIQDVLKIESDDITRHQKVAHTLSSLNRNESSSTLEMANALWIANWFNLYDSYISISRDVYLATAERVDFATDTDASVKKINDWAATKTHDKIDKVVEKRNIDANTAMVITNAIYFKGSWLTEFSVNDTIKSTFWKNSKYGTDVDFMNMKETFAYTTSDDAQILKLPYKDDRLSMMIILPNDKDGIYELEKNISLDLIKKWNQSVQPKEVKVSIPKFTIDENYDLKKLLIEMGIVDVFDSNLSNLSGIADVTGQNLVVTQASHNAYVSVYEEGTEAAATTTIIVTLTSAGLEFIVDHPFLFLIQDDENGTILFLGKIMDPS